jgi:ribosome-binding factor A
VSERTARLDHLLREEISAIIAKEIADPRIGFVTVTQVEVAPDLGHATVWVSVIGSPEDRRRSVRALGRAMPFVRHRLGELHLKRIPELHLREDDSAVRGTRVMRILDELREGSEDVADEAGDLPTPGPARSAPEEAAPPRRTRKGSARGARKGRPRGR